MGELIKTEQFKVRDLNGKVFLFADVCDGQVSIDSQTFASRQEAANIFRELADALDGGPKHRRERKAKGA